MYYLDFYRESLGKRFKENGEEKSILVGPKSLLTRCVKEGSKYLKLMSI